MLRSVLSSLREYADRVAKEVLGLSCPVEVKVKGFLPGVDLTERERIVVRIPITLIGRYLECAKSLGNDVLELLKGLVFHELLHAWVWEERDVGVVWSYGVSLDAVERTARKFGVENKFAVVVGFEAYLMYLLQHILDAVTYEAIRERLGEVPEEWSEHITLLACFDIMELIMSLPLRIALAQQCGKLKDFVLFPLVLADTLSRLSLRLLIQDRDLRRVLSHMTLAFSGLPLLDKKELLQRELGCCVRLARSLRSQPLLDVCVEASRHVTDLLRRVAKNEGVDVGVLMYCTHVGDIAKIFLRVI